MYVTKGGGGKRDFEKKTPQGAGLWLCKFEEMGYVSKKTK